MQSEESVIPQRFTIIPAEYIDLFKKYHDLLFYAESFTRSYEALSDHAMSLEARMMSAIESSEMYRQAYTELFDLHRNSVLGEQTADNEDWVYSIPKE